MSLSGRRSPHLTSENLAVDFFNHLNMLYGTVTEFCTPQQVDIFGRFRDLASNARLQCPIMSAGPRYEYLWEDGVTYKRPTKLNAPDYVDALMNWVQGLLDDEKVFPNKIGEKAEPLKWLVFTFGFHRRSIPPELPGDRQDDCEAAIPGLCPFVQSSF